MRNRQILGRLIWKHLREMRTLCIVLIAASITLQWLLIFVEGGRNSDGMFVISVLIGTCFATATALLAFTGERHRGTDTRLLAMSVQPGTLLLAALSASLIGYVAIIGVGMLHAATFGGARGIKDGLWAALYLGALPLAFLIGGLVCRTPVRAIGVGGVVAGAMGFGIIWAQEALRSRYTKQVDQVLILALCTALAAGLLSLNYWLTKRWCKWPFGRTSSRTRFASKAFGQSATSAWFSSNLKTIARLRVPAFWRKVLAIWRTELRASRWFFLLAAVFAGLGLLTGWFNGAPVPTAAFFASVCGVMSFESESSKNRIRFYTERGVSRKTLWVSKQVLWLSAVAVFGLVVAGWFAYETNSGDSRPYPNPLADRNDFDEKMLAIGFVVLLQTCFMSAQFAALWFRQRIAGVAIGLFTFPLMMLWPSVVRSIGIPPVVGLAPLLVGTSYASWLWFERWMNRRHSVRDRLPVCLVLSVGIVGCWLLPTLLRIYRIPPPPEVPLATTASPELLDRLSLPGNETQWKSRGELSTEQKRWAAEMDAFGDRLSPEAENDRDTGDAVLAFSSEALSIGEEWQTLTEAEQAWYHRHAAAIPELVELVQRPEALGWIEHRAVVLLQLDALRLASEGNIAESIERICLLVRAWGYDSVRHPHLQIARACCHPNATLADVQLARQRIREHVRRQRWSFGSTDWLSKAEIYQSRDDSSVDLGNAAASTLFGESPQFVRLYAWRDAVYRGQVIQFRDALQRSLPTLPVADQTISQLEMAERRLRQWSRTSPLLRLDWQLQREQNMISWGPMWTDLDFITRTRAAVAILDVVEHVIEHGRFPTAVSQLDPWTATPFSLVPKGLDHDLKLLPNGLERKGERPAAVLAGTPFLWARGSFTRSPNPAFPDVPFFVVGPAAGDPLRSNLDIFPIPTSLLKLIKEPPPESRSDAMR